MKKLLRVIASFAVVVGIVSVSISPATYAVGCEDLVITNTGESSTNIIECEDIVDVSIECVNNIIVANASFQNGESGDAIGTGSVKTGTVINDNETRIVVGTACGEEETTPVTPVTPTTPTTPASPTTTTSATTPAATPVSAKPASLPYTSGSYTTTLAVAAAVLALGFAVTRLGLVLYRRRTSK